MRIRSLIVPLAGFLLVLLVMNGYQYFKIKQNVAAGVVKELGAVEVRELKTLFSEIGERLLLLKGLCETESLSEKNAKNLSRKMAPFLDRLEFASGILLADSTGAEHYLYSDGADLVARITSMSGENAVQKSVKWSSSFEEVKRWKETRRYDPRQRPWFVKGDVPGEVHWTGIYNFFHSNMLGITASVSWQDAENIKEYTVLGVDITVEKIQAILAARDVGRPGFLFLAKGDESFLRGDSKALQRDNVVQSLMAEWNIQNGPNGKIIRVTEDKIKWVGIFQRVDSNSNVFYVGFAATEEELTEWLDSTLLSVDLFDILFALGGAIFILLLMWKFGLLHKKEEPLDPPEIRLFSYINMGEGAGVEFKSTVRTNLKTGKSGKEIEIAWLKGVVAFLNSDGGTVLLGVDDSGKILGIAVDLFENSDRCLLHIKNLLNQHIGAELSPFFSAILVEVEEKEVVMIECNTAGDAVFLKIGKNEEFYIRSGPSSVKLSPSQIVRYVLKKQKK
jgi:hypothetical protein